MKNHVFTRNANPPRRGERECENCREPIKQDFVELVVQDRTGEAKVSLHTACWQAITGTEPEVEVLEW